MAKVSKGFSVPLCKNCSRLFNENEFYRLSNGDYIPYCKDCCETMIYDEHNAIDLDNVNILLRSIDKAFYYDIWTEAINLGEPYFQHYLDLLEKYKKIGHTYKKSDTKDNNEDVKKISEDADKWGTTDANDIEFLEKEYHEWATSYEIDSKAMVDSVKQLCLIELDIRKARKSNDVQALDKLLRIKSQILGDANLKPVQETGNAANEQVSIGMLIKKFEQEEPIPEDTAPDWIDEMKIWIVGQLARMEGLDSEVTEDFNKELSKYGIDVDEALDEKLGDG